MEDLTPWQQYKKNLGETRPWDLVNPATEFVTDEVAESRYSICKQCPEFLGLTKQCKKCGCFMNLKTKMHKATCPLEKW